MEIKKIALFGATGQTGIEFIQQCKNSPNLEVKAFVRNPEKLKKKLVEIPINLSIVPFQLSEMRSWEQELKDCQYWVSLIGISGIFQARKPNALYENTASMLIKLHEQFKPQNILIVTSGGVVDSPSEPWILKGFLKPLFLNPMYDDMRVMERLITKSSMNFTIIRPPYLTNGPLKQEYRTILDKWFDDDKVLSRKDLAHFIKTAIEKQPQEYQKRIVGVSY